MSKAKQHRWEDIWLHMLQPTINGCTHCSARETLFRSHWKSHQPAQDHEQWTVPSVWGHSLRDNELTALLKVRTNRQASPHTTSMQGDGGKNCSMCPGDTHPETLNRPHHSRSWGVVQCLHHVCPHCRVKAFEIKYRTCHSWDVYNTTYSILGKKTHSNY